MKKATFTEKQPDYRYFPLADGDGKADVFIYSYIGESAETTGEYESVVYEYDINEFRVSQNLITEDMVKANPMKYLDYTPASPPTDHERLEAMEQAFIEFVSEVL